MKEGLLPYILQTLKEKLENIINNSVSKFDNLDETDKFSQKYNLIKLIKDEIQNLNSPYLKKIEFIIRNFPQRKLQVSLVKYIKQLKKK